MKTDWHTIVVGAGPAGLTAAYTLSKNSAPTLVLESDPARVGGISKTVDHRGYLFDIGGHRFFTRSTEVDALWTELLPDGFVNRPRKSRIYYRGKFFDYPLRPLDATLKLGPGEAFLCVASYLRARIFPVRDPRNFQDWVSNEFGRRLFRIFFKTYTEKVWGMDCRAISADWAQQRIKGLSLGTALATATGLDRLTRRATPKTYIENFRYPRQGPGMLWTACAEKIRALGGEVSLGQRVVFYRFDASERRWHVRYQSGSGDEREATSRYVISTAPLRETCRIMSPPLSDEARTAASRLAYRDFLLVGLILNRPLTFEDQWIYIHDPGVKVGRIQNFSAWSPAMVPAPGCPSLGLEYFCSENDGLWAMTDEDLIELAKQELGRIGLATGAHVIDACVIRQPKAYPVYDHTYAENVERIRRELAARCPQFYTVGRNGMHKYNNQDHSMMTALLAARNILAEKPLYDPWRVNIDAEYHEETGAGSSGERLTPRLLE